MEQVITPTQQIKQPNKKKKLSIVLLIIVLTFIVAFLFSLKKIKSVKVINNHIVSDQYIIDLIGIHENDSYFYTFHTFKEAKAKNSPFIQDAKITFTSNGILIDINDNAIVGYTNLLEEENYITYFVMANGTFEPFDASVIKGLALLPFFSNASKENISLIAQQIAKLDFDIVSRFSDISVVSFTYDANMVKLIGNDGYTSYSSIKGLIYLKNYLDIIINDSSSNNKCLLIMEEYSKAILLKCSEMNQYFKTEE